MRFGVADIRIIRRLWSCALLLWLLPFTGIAAQADLPANGQATGATPDVAGPAAKDSNAPNSPGAALREGTTTSQYLIGPGDTLLVFVWQNPDLSTTVPVRPDGKISTPLVEDLIAVGKTPAQLARDMESVLSQFVRNPRVNIIVNGAQSTFSQVKVIGQVKTPESIAYREGMTVLDLILHAGGLTEFAAGNRAKLIRPQPGGKDAEFKLRLQDLVKKGKLSQNMALHPGDVVIVPESRF
jgi:polysaccharide biosynthesis/export protein